MIEILAVLSASAAAGMRIALPLLIIGLLSTELWGQIPLLAGIPPRLVIAVLVSWSLFELLASKQFLARRFLQLTQLLFSPIVGYIMGAGVAIALATDETPAWLIWLLGIIGGLFAFVLQLVMLAWSYRRPHLPLWAIFAQDILCVALVLFAIDAPHQGGLIALLLLWLAIRTSQGWQRWYLAQGNAHQAPDRRRYRQGPD